MKGSPPYYLTPSHRFDYFYLYRRGSELGEDNVLRISRSASITEGQINSV